MIALLEHARGALAPTKCYDRREWFWRAADRYDEDRDGTLTILLTHSGKRRVKTTLSVYRVQVEWEYAVDFGARSFLLENWTEPDAEGPFRCVVGGMREECGCEMGGFDRRRLDVVGCKHRDALRALIEHGGIG